MPQTIVVIAEHFAGQIKPVTYELVAYAKKLQLTQPLAIKAVILGDEVANLAQDMADTCGLEVTAVRIPELTTYNAEIYKTVLTELIPDLSAAYVCIAHTSQGMDYAPALAVGLNAACISGVEDILEVDGRTCFARPIYGGKAIACVQPQSKISILTIQPGIFKPQKQARTVCGTVTIKPISCRPLKIRPMGVKQAAADTAGVTEASVIVAAGQGIGDRDNLNLIYQLAALFTKSAVAGSRIVCDMGWLQYNCQVGVTGATVSPRLYIACGISGAVQHVTGMRGSEFIVAINKDPSAAIFQVADICIVEDLITFIPAFIEAYENTKSH